MDSTRMDGLDWDFNIYPLLWEKISNASSRGWPISESVSWVGSGGERINGRVVYVPKLHRITFLEHR